MKVVHHIRGTYSILLLLSASLLGAQTPSPQASGSPGGPDATMMATVTALASYMAHVEGAVLPRVFVDDGLVIVEDFAPYIFTGKDAAGDAVPRLFQTAILRSPDLLWCARADLRSSCATRGGSLPRPCV